MEWSLALLSFLTVRRTAALDASESYRAVLDTCVRAPQNIFPHTLAQAQDGGFLGGKLRIAQQVYAASRLVPHSTLPEVTTQTEGFEDQGETVTRDFFTMYVYPL